LVSGIHTAQTDRISHHVGPRQNAKNSHPLSWVL
jgi:hypothetical protein